MYNAGVVYQITGDKKYAAFVRCMLLAYAEIYPSLPVHPARFTKTPGKIFYQILNEAVWLTFTANAYDCVYEYISAAERQRIEDNLFRPIVDFMENGTPANNTAFNSMHNFGTWMTAGTGMIGYVMDDREMIDKALKGSAKDGKTGFLPQLDALFFTRRLLRRRTRIPALRHLSVRNAGRVHKQQPAGTAYLRLPRRHSPESGKHTAPMHLRRRYFF